MTEPAGSSQRSPGAAGGGFASQNETLQSFVQSLQGYGTQTALFQLRQSNADWSYAELISYAAELAAGLRARGLAPGDRVILFAPNSVEWVAACLALLEAGLIPVPIDSQIGHDDLTHIVKDSDSAWAFTTALGAKRLRQCDVSRELNLVLLDQAREEGVFWRELLASPCEHAEVDADDCAFLFYTSGTSGPPKGVPLSHANIVSNMTAVLAQEIVRPGDRILLPLPLHHVYPLVVGLLVPLSMGLSVIFPRSLIGAHFFAAMNEGEVTILLGVPRLYSAFFNAIGQGVAARSGILRGAFHAAMFVSIAVQKAFRLDWGAWLFASLRHRIAPRLRLLVSGGAPLEPDLARNIRALGWPVASGYGLTETSPILTFNMPGLCPVKSAGRPLPGVQLRIAEPAPGLRHGEVQAKGPNVFACYLNLPEKTQAAFTQDGWFRTGDLGYLDESGALYLIGRTSSMIVLPGGENIVPDNLEERLEESSYIAEIGILEHEGRLVGVAVPGRALEQTSQDPGMEQRIREEIAKLCAGLPSYQRLGDVVLDAGPLPRTRLGKIRRPKLAQLYTQLRSSRSQSEASAPAPPRLSQEDSQLLEDPVAAGVWAWLSERFPEHRLSPDTNVRMDLGVDSLEWLNLTLEIRNRVSVELSDDAVGRIQTVRDLLQECAAAEYAVGVPGEILDALRDPQSLLDQRARDRFEVHPWLAGILDPVAVLMARTLMKALFRFRVEGLSHLPILGPYVVAPNHCSSLDPIAVTAALGSRRLHDTYWAGWVGILFRSPLASLLSRVMRVLPVEPRLGPLSNLALAAAALARGGNLIWFPEGRRSPTGELQKFLPGIGILLRAYSVPVVPVWIEGSAQALPPGTLRPRRSPVALRFGEPVLAARLEAEGCGETSDERIADGLRARVQALSGLANHAGSVSGEPPR